MFLPASWVTLGNLKKLTTCGCAAFPVRRCSRLHCRCFGYWGSVYRTNERERDIGGMRCTLILLLWVDSRSRVMMLSIYWATSKQTNIIERSPPDSPSPESRSIPVLHRNRKDADKICYLSTRTNITRHCDSQLPLVSKFFAGSCTAPRDWARPLAMAGVN
jgi:hypothetical protein